MEKPSHKRKPLKEWPWKNIIALILLLTLAASLVFTIIRLVQAPVESEMEGERQKSDYVLMIVQCGLGLVVMLLPGLIERKLHIDVPDFIEVLFFIFLYCAIYLGEVRSFYYRIPMWDSFLHLFSGAMLGALGYSLVSILNDTPKLKVQLSPLFVGLFAFCFALAMGALWEIYEFTFDGILGLNMQKFRLEDGTDLIGRAALADTMKDLIVDAVGALVLVVVGALLRRRKEKRATAA